MSHSNGTIIANLSFLTHTTDRNVHGKDPNYMNPTVKFFISSCLHSHLTEAVLGVARVYFKVQGSKL